MMSIERALSLYTDSVNDNEPIDMEYYQKNLSKDDYHEFCELIEILNLIKSREMTKRYNKIFEDVDTYKNELYNQMNTASNFRSEKDADLSKASKNLDELFDEEFGDEE